MEVNDKKIMKETNKFENDVLGASEMVSIYSVDRIVASDNKFENPSTETSELSSVPRRSQRNKLTSNKTTPETIKPAEQHKIKQSTKNNAVISTTQMASILWRELTLKGFEIQIGMIVCAKMTTFWPWPAQVINFQRNRTRVKLFGDLREGSVPKSQCVPFINCHHIVFNYISSIDKLTKHNFKKNDSAQHPK